MQTTPETASATTETTPTPEAPARKRYELMLIVSGKVADAEVPAVAADVKKVFAKHDASVVDETVWGRLKFAYELKHEKAGTYLLWHLDVLPSKVRALDAELRVVDHVLRFLLIEAPAHGAAIPAPTQVTRESATRESREGRESSEARTAVPAGAAAPKTLDQILDEQP